MTAESTAIVTTTSTVLSWVSTILWRTTQIVTGLASILVTLLYFKQESMLYFPEIGGIPKRPSDNPRKYRSPAEHNINFEDVHIPCDDGVTIHAWLMLRTAASTDNPLPTFVYFHGNAGNIGLRLPNAIQMMQYLHVNILLVEYRGYGNSDSVQPNESGLKLDGQAALNYVLKHPHLNKSKIFLFGRSLGGAVAFATAEYAQRNNIALGGIIVENTFMSIPNMVDHLMPIVAPFKGLILKMKWDSTTIVPTIQYPVLYLAGAKDQLVPHQHMLTLHATTKQSKLNKLYVVPNGTHNETWMQGGDDYYNAMKQFLRDAIDINTKFPLTGVSINSSSGHDRSSSSKNDGTTASINAGETSTSSSSSSSIPIMPNRLFGMMKEAVQGTSSGNNTKDKKKEL